MKTLACLPFALVSVALLSLAACDPSDAPNAAAMKQAVDRYLAERGHLCLGKSAWPIDVDAASVGANGAGRDALQMPVLEKLGLVSSGDAVAERRTDDGPAKAVKVRRYSLTPAGRAHLVDNPARGGADFCVARLTLDKVVGWEPPAPAGSAAETVVTYTYRIDAAAWTQDREAQRVFPMVARVIAGAGTMQLKQAFTRTAGGWQAKG
jgi:hypothetical protein